MLIEPITQKAVDSLTRVLGGLQSMILQIAEVDLSKGRGVLESKDGNDVRCLWTKDGHRITITICRDGSVIGTCSKTPDPQCPK